MKRHYLYCLAFCLLLSITSCNTYYIAASEVPVDLYTNNEGTDVKYSLTTGSVLLLKGKPKNGFTRVKFHSDANWYWVDYSRLSLVPYSNPKYYLDSYANIENSLAASKSTSGSRVTGIKNSGSNSGYDATIQTGSRGGKYYINKNGNKTYVKRSTPAGTVKRVGGKGSRGGKH